MLVLVSCGGSGSVSNQSDQTTMPVPNLMATLEGGTLSASIQVYNASGTLEYEGDLVIDNGQVSSDDFTLTQGQTYNFVITFNYTTSAGDTLPVAYVRVSQQIAGDSVAIAYTESDISYDLLEGISNDLSPSFNIGGSYVIPNLDSDGDGVSNIRELITGTDPFDSNDTPDLITTNLVYGDTISGVIRLIATYNGNQQIRSMYLESPSGNIDIDSTPSIYQADIDTSSFDEGNIDFVFVVILNDNSINRYSFTSTVDNLPNINFFGVASPVEVGSDYTLVWDVDNVDLVEVDNGFGSLDSSGELVVAHDGSANTVTYNLTATNQNGSVSQSLVLYFDSTILGQDPDQEGGVEFVWNPIQGVEEYTISIYTSSDCSSGLVDTTTSTSSNVTIDGLSPKMIYYYQVLSGTDVVFDCQKITVGHEGLIGWWTFDEGEGTVAYDSSQTGNNIEIIDADMWVTGSDGHMINLDRDKYFIVAEDDYILPENDFSIEFWVKSATSSDRRVFTTGDPFDYSNPFSMNMNNEAYELWFNTFDIYGTTDVPYNLTRFDGVLNQVVVTYDASESVFKVYINGALHSYQRFAVDWDNSGLTFGRSGFAVLDYFVGFVDEVAVYNRILSSIEVRQNCFTSSSRLGEGSCADEYSPEVLSPFNGAEIEPTRIYYSWQNVEIPDEKTISYYQVCEHTTPTSAESSVIAYDGCYSSLENTVNRFYIKDVSSTTSTSYSHWFQVRAVYTDGTVGPYSQLLKTEISTTIRGWWKFDSISSNSSVNEISSRPDAYQGDGNKLPYEVNLIVGTICEGDDVSGFNNGAACFDGVNDFFNFYTSSADVSDDESYNFTRGYTIVARVFPNSNLTNFAPIFSRWNADASVDQKQYSLNTSVTQAEGYVTSGTYSLSEDYEDRSWRFLLITSDTHSSQPRLYVDGILDGDQNGSESYTSYSSSYGSFYSSIGYQIYNSFGAARYYKGAIDEVMVMEKPVGPIQALNIYCAFEAEMASSDLSYEMPEVCTE